MKYLILVLMLGVFSSTVNAGEKEDRQECKERADKIVDAILTNKLNGVDKLAIVMRYQANCIKEMEAKATKKN